MPKCRICGDEFENSVYTGFTICGCDECWTKAWNGAILPLNPNAKIQSSVQQNKPKRKKIPKKDKDKIIEMFKQGKNRKEIAEICNIDYGNVCYIIRGAKVIR